jgi:hypothetical protein
VSDLIAPVWLDPLGLLVQLGFDWFFWLIREARCGSEGNVVLWLLI